MKEVEDGKATVEKAKAKVVADEEGSGEVERDLEGVTSQIDAHKAENKRRERRKKSEARAAQGEIWRVFWWRRPTVRRRWGFRLRLEREGRFPGGVGLARFGVGGES